MPIGYAMGFYGPYMLYVTELGFAVLSYILIMKVITSLEISSKANYLNPPTEEFEENEDLENRLPL